MAHRRSPFPHAMDSYDAHRERAYGGETRASEGETFEVMMARQEYEHNCAIAAKHAALAAAALATNAAQLMGYVCDEAAVQRTIDALQLYARSVHHCNPRLARHHP